MEGLGPRGVVRGATFDCGLAVVAEVVALPVADVLLAALLLLGEELQPARPMAIATIAIVAPLLLAAVRFIELAPVDRASPRDNYRRFPDQPRWPCSRAAIYAFALMFCGTRWSELGVSGLLPTGTVTLLFADVEGSTRLWETQPEQMTVAMARMNQMVTETIATHSGVRPVEQGGGDSFVAALPPASHAVARGLEWQRAPLAPIRLRIGIHTGEIQLRDEGNYAGPTINRTARLRDLGHGGQTLLSGTTEALVLDGLPDDVRLADLGTQSLRDLPRPERVTQLCHPDLVNDFAPLRVARLASEGLSNNDVATRLFVSPRTVQTHLTHVYTKLSLTSRVQLVQEAARHTSS